jgi:hypothetical protein
MAGDVDGMAGLTATAPAWDRFANWSKLPARLLLVAMALVLIASALVPIGQGPMKVQTNNSFEILAGNKEHQRDRDDDLKLYDRAIERIGNGEHYYDFIVAEHRKARYPVHPGFAVRLPTLAYLNAWLGVPGQIAAAILLLIATLLVWWRRLSEEPGILRRRTMAIALLFLGASLGLNRDFFVLHELWAGMLLACSFGLHRPGRWVGSLAVAALALAIREFSLPFVLLMAATAFWRGDRKEGVAWGLLAVLFLALLTVHLQIIAAQVLPSDPPSPSWFALRGLSGWLSNVAMSSNIRALPHWLAGPIVMLSIFGWGGWRSAAGAFGTLLFIGYGVFFMIAGRYDNFYWGFMIAPAMFLGLAFVPDWLRSLWHSCEIANTAPR